MQKRSKFKKTLKTLPGEKNKIEILMIVFDGKIKDDKVKMPNLLDKFYIRSTKKKLYTFVKQ